MITIKHGSIFDSSAAVLVCPVNCVGVMGKGLALEFKKRFPEECARYMRLGKAGCHRPGDVYWDCTGDGDKWFAFAMTKKHWRDPSKLTWVDMCLENIACAARSDRSSIAIPQLGCGCGGLDWAEVWPLYERHLGGLDCDVEVWIHE